MSLGKRSSALSDLIRQATEGSSNPDAPPNSAQGSTPASRATVVPIIGVGQAQSTYAGQDLTETFFPGSSLRSSFMPKSLTHHGPGTHGTGAGLLGSYRPGAHWTPGDASQVSGASPPFGTLGSAAPGSSVATGGGGGASVGSAALQPAAHHYTATDVDTAAVGGASGATSQPNTVGVSPTAGAGADAQHAWPAWATRVAAAVAAAAGGQGHGQGDHTETHAHAHTHASAHSSA